MISMSILFCGQLVADSKIFFLELKIIIDFTKFLFEFVNFIIIF